MRTMSGTLISFLNSSRQYIMVDLFTFELRNGVTLRYCTSNVAVQFGGDTWLPAPAGLSRSRIRWVTGIEVDTMDIQFQADASITVNTIPMLAAAVQGLFDNAKVTLGRLFMSDWSTAVDKVDLFKGSVSAADARRSALHMSVKSDLERLNVQMPQTLYQASCVHSLFDIGCSVNAATYTVAGTITGVNVDGSLQTGLGQADAYFQMGSIKITSGPNLGLVRTVKSFASGAVFIANPFPFTITAGVTFTITPGCDKLRTGDCTTKYANTVNFKGFEFIPVPETAA